MERRLVRGTKIDTRETKMFGFGEREEIGQVLGERMDRRRVLRAAGLMGAAAVAGGMLKAMPAGAEAITFYKTTANLNLREKPSTSGKVIVVMPKGSKVALVGSSGKNGFLKVDYHGAT